MHMPNTMGRFHLYSDTSKFATGSALYQIQNGKAKLIAYASKRLPDDTKNYSINSVLYLRTIKDKYIMLYRALISQLCIYASAIRILVKGYLPNTLVTPSKLKEILTEVRKMFESLIQTMI